MNVKNKLMTGMATAAMMIGVFTSSAGATGTVTSGNGAFSSNLSSQFNYVESMLMQTGTTNAQSNITSLATSGGSNSNYGTGSSWWTTPIMGGSITGNSASNVGVSVWGGDNHLSVIRNNGGSSTGMGVTALIGNGAFSRNTALDTTIDKFKVNQANSVIANTSVNSNANSGSNTSNFNTGSTITQTTGSASSNVGVGVKAGDNTAMVGTMNNGGNSGSSTVVAGNGAFSDNMTASTNISTTDIVQSAMTAATTNVTSGASSGNNTANYNTGGTNSQSTGGTSSNVGVVVTGGDNMLTN